MHFHLKQRWELLQSLSGQEHLKAMILMKGQVRAQGQRQAVIWRQPGFDSTVEELCFLHCSDYPCQMIWVKTTVLRYGAGRTSRGQRGGISLSWYCHQNSSAGKCRSEEGVWTALVHHSGKSLRGAGGQDNGEPLGKRLSGCSSLPLLKEADFLHSSK